VRTEIVPVARYAVATSAHLARSKLEAAGIRAVVLDEHLASTDPMLGLAAGGIKVAVLRADLPAAREVLGFVPDAHDPDPCPACGSTDVGVKRLWLFLVLYAFTLGRAEPERLCQDCHHAWD